MNSEVVREWEIQLNERRTDPLSPNSAISPSITAWFCTYLRVRQDAWVQDDQVRALGLKHHQAQAGVDNADDDLSFREQQHLLLEGLVAEVKLQLSIRHSDVS